MTAQLQKNDLRDALNYLLEHEGQDFHYCLTAGDGCIHPLEGVDATAWRRKLREYLDFDQLSPSEYSDQLFDWLALNSDGHVYCSAVRLKAIADSP